MIIPLLSNLLVTKFTILLGPISVIVLSLSSFMTPMYHNGTRPRLIFDSATVDNYINELIVFRGRPTAEDRIPLPPNVTSSHEPPHGINKKQENLF